MSDIIIDIKNKIINEIVAQIQKNIIPARATLIGEFVRQLYGSVALEDLASAEFIDLYGNILSIWQFIEIRKPGETKVRVYNPHYEQHGWQSSHTILEVCCEDMPFIVDSLSMELMRLGFNIHFAMHLGGMCLQRNAHHEASTVQIKTESSPGEQQEAFVYFEIDKQTDPAVLQNIQENIQRVLSDVHVAVVDWPIMQERMKESLRELSELSSSLEADEVKEAEDFLQWMLNDHFTFLGCRDYKITGEGEEKAVKIVRDSGLGVLRNASNSKVSRAIVEMPMQARKQILSQQIIIIAKTNTVSTIHRPVYTDYVGVKRFDTNGEIIGERRFIGLYTSTAYNARPKYIPLLRRKIAQVMQMSQLPSTGHAGKALLNILETLPRDDLFQAQVDELYELGMGIYHLLERKRIRLFMRKDVYGRFYSCLVYVPRDRYSTELRVNMQKVLLHSLQGTFSTAETQFTESALARIHYVVRVPKEAAQQMIDIKVVEQALIEAGRSWKDELFTAIIEHYGEEKGIALIQQYEDAFPTSYQEIFSPRSAVYDIEHCCKLNNAIPLGVNLYTQACSESDVLYFKSFQCNETMMLSDALPVFENMGMRVMGEQSYELNLKNGQRFFINNFSMRYESAQPLNVEQVRDIFHDAFYHVWFGTAENDGFNRLVLSAKLTWREVALLRCYAKYLRQIGVTFSQSYMESALIKNAEIAALLVALFNARFSLTQTENRETLAKQIREKIEHALENDVANLDEDRIIRRFLVLILATVRTNYFQQKEDNQYKSSISIKLDPESIVEMPLPKPKFEIFVYSPRFEAVHLRAAKVARGGIRWSDRREDFRTEILGLMKAQQVKNAVIVPLGAKGGFVPKCLSLNGTREEVMAEVITCYKDFMRGLLDLTDNLVNGNNVAPRQVICYDEPDPYLVVAADKGTATFSDIANQISKEYNFWLGDAFASGGSAGYDHKKMGITARGAWESVKCHFREMGYDINTNFTVVGIGDMSGDVFGNGMLLSKHICLVGAFNHQHIFIDPNPDGEKSLSERQRLFDLPRSSWEDYKPELISPGGGIFKRSAKYINVSKEMKARFAIKTDTIAPNDLIHVLLMSEVDLLWNGGIGTYVKSSEELDVNVGDRANDAIRVNGSQVRAKMIGEGGNLGCTQLGRVEYALQGGICFTDFIDNSAGVDCSDHEVNAKILLNAVLANGDMTEKQRNQILAGMTEEIGQLVLQDNYRQTKAISRAIYSSVENIDLYTRFARELEQQNLLNRNLEFLPNDKAIQVRKSSGKGFTRPEIAILLSYSKNILKRQLYEAGIVDDAEMRFMLEQAFPKQLSQQFSKQMELHSLRREIVATQLANTIVNEMGLAFVYRIQEETGADVAAIARAYLIAREAFEWQRISREIDALDGKLDAAVQANMVITMERLIRRATRWILRHRHNQLSIATAVDNFKPAVMELRRLFPSILRGSTQQDFERSLTHLQKLNVPAGLAHDVACCSALFCAFDMIEEAKTQQVSLTDFAEIYFALGNALELDWLRERRNALTVTSRWEALARAEYHDELDYLQRCLAASVVLLNNKKQNCEERVKQWLACYPEQIQRWHKILQDMRNTAVDYTVLYIALRELASLRLI